MRDSLDGDSILYGVSDQNLHFLAVLHFAGSILLLVYGEALASIL